MNAIQIKRGEIYYAMLDPVVGRETGKTRPVLIVQNDVGKSVITNDYCRRHH
jgi:mRNA interferase MazF